MAEQKTQQNESAFDKWLFRNGIRISPSLKDKLTNNHLDSVDVLQELKAMNGLTEASRIMNLNIIEKSVFSVIIRKIQVVDNISSKIVAITPSFISAKDNKNGTVDLKLKLIQSPLKNDGNNQLTLEWAEDEKCFSGAEAGIVVNLNNIDIDTIQEIKNIPTKFNANALRLVWRNYGNVKPLKLRCEKWDAKHCANIISVSGDIIKHCGSKDEWCSIYGTIICKYGFEYHWKFKVKTYKHYFMFGIEKVTNQYGLENSYAGAKGVVYYSRPEITYIYPTQNGKSFKGDYGCKRMNHNGGELDMYLDLKNWELRFETDGVDVGYKISE
eukprot:231267_1